MDARITLYGASVDPTFEGAGIADAAGGVPDQVGADAVEHDDQDQFAALVGLIALINADNRMNVIVRRPAGDYQPGQSA